MLQSKKQPRPPRSRNEWTTAQRQLRPDRFARKEPSPEDPEKTAPCRKRPAKQKARNKTESSPCESKSAPAWPDSVETASRQNNPKSVIRLAECVSCFRRGMLLCILFASVRILLLGTTEALHISGYLFSFQSKNTHRSHKIPAKARCRLTSLAQSGS